MMGRQLQLCHSNLTCNACIVLQTRIYREKDIAQSEKHCQGKWKWGQKQFKIKSSISHDFFSCQLQSLKYGNRIGQSRSLRGYFIFQTYRLQSTDRHHWRISLSVFILLTACFICQQFWNQSSFTANKVYFHLPSFGLTNKRIYKLSPSYHCKLSRPTYTLIGSIKDNTLIDWIYRKWHLFSFQFNTNYENCHIWDLSYAVFPQKPAIYGRSYTTSWVNPSGLGSLLGRQSLVDSGLRLHSRPHPRSLQAAPGHRQ